MRKFAMLWLAALVLASSMLAGQTRSPRLTGKVLDSSGAEIRRFGYLSSKAMLEALKR